MAVTPTYEGLFNDLIDGYVNGNRDTSVPQPAVSSINWDDYYKNQTYEDTLKDSKIKLWQKILEYFGNWRTPIQNFPNTNSLFSYVASKIDGVDSLPTPPNEVWNDSVQLAIDTFNRVFGNNGEIVLKTYTEGGEEKQVVIKINDIKNADAGNSFEESPWVKPNTNIDEKTYDEVRGADKITSVLKNESQLQFTHQGNTNSWIRLLMPKYIRTVEVEDLNRNFWVIGQTVSAICAFLFGKNGLPDLLESLLKEIVGLWENVLYLWSTFALLTDEQYGLHYEVVPICNWIEAPYRKFDGFDCPRARIRGMNGNPGTEAEMIEDIKGRLSYLKDMYNKDNLFIVPEIREVNYKHNYYSRVEYPGAYYYDRKNNQEYWIKFNVTESEELDPQESILPHNDPTWLYIDLQEAMKDNQEYIDKIYGIREEEIEYYGEFPFSNTVNQDTAYYGMLRIIPYILYDDNHNTIQVKFKVCDAAAKALENGNGDYQLYKYESQDIDLSNVLNNCNLVGNYLPYWDSDPEPTPNPNIKVQIEQGYYMGELVSTWNIINWGNFVNYGVKYWGTPVTSGIPSVEIALGLIDTLNQ